MWNPFGKKAAVENESTSRSENESEDIYAPSEGRVLPLDEVPDPVFASRALGDGFAVEPTSGGFCAPVDGELILVAATHHAFAIRTKAGAEVLVHIGLDTVKLNGAGFIPARSKGEHVKAGDLVIACDLGSVSGSVPSMITPVVVTNGDAFTISSPDLGAPAGAAVATLSAK